MTDSQRLKDAATLAVEAHSGQMRKIEEIPYVSHLFAVAALVAEYGGTTDQMIGALLHDLVEDTLHSLDYVRGRFGEAVAEIVAGLTEQKEIAAYRNRKREYAHRLSTEVADGAVLVALADKTHNLETSLRHLDDGHDIFRRFPSIVWYNEMLLDALRGRVGEDSPDGTKRLLARYLRAVEALQDEAKAAA
jgi:(p)ppGpp synthase/HD superfamily hydrolase